MCSRPYADPNPHRRVVPPVSVDDPDHPMLAALIDRFVEALGGEKCTSDREYDHILVAASLIVAYEKKRRTYIVAEWEALSAKGLAKKALDWLHLPGSSADLLDGPGLT
jgi:hypothetical protein